MIQPVSSTENISTPLVISASFQRLAMEKYIEGIQLEKQGSLSQGNPHCVPILQVSSTDFLSFPKSADLFPTGIQVGS
jgi:hypothetical protein